MANKKSTPRKTSSSKVVCGRNLEELRVLGAGGQGTVSLFRDRASQRLFALKTTLSSDAAEGLRDEFSIARHLMDSGVDGIVAIHAIGKDETSNSPSLFMLMDFCNGGDLLSVLKRRHGFRLQDREAAAVMRSLVETLIRCHNAGVMHRDIKLENVLITSSHGSPSAGAIHHGKKRSREGDSLENHERFLLSDFGLACSFRHGHHIRDGSLAGTTHYIAPEMLLKGSYDEQADVWSLGVLLHVILTGKFPIQSIEMARLQMGYPPTTDHNVWEMEWSNPIYSHLSDGARSFLRGMLQKKPSHRMALWEASVHPWLHRDDVAKLDNVSGMDIAGRETPAKKIRFIFRKPPPVVGTSAPVDVATTTTVPPIEKVATPAAAAVNRVKAMRIKLRGQEVPPPPAAAVVAYAAPVGATATTTATTVPPTEKVDAPEAAAVAANVIKAIRFKLGGREVCIREFPKGQQEFHAAPMAMVPVC